LFSGQWAWPRDQREQGHGDRTAISKLACASPLARPPRRRAESFSLDPSHVKRGQLDGMARLFTQKAEGRIQAADAGKALQRRPERRVSCALLLSVCILCLRCGRVYCASITFVCEPAKRNSSQPRGNAGTSAKRERMTVQCQDRLISCTR
jgi:hypothetical protein